MEHYGHGGREMLDKWEQILVLLTDHHQFKYLVLHGVYYLKVLVEVVQHSIVLQAKLMEHYCHGEIIKKENWDKIV